MASSSPIKAEKESDLTPPSAETLEFDDATLRAEVYKKEGNDEYKKHEFSSAIDFYTKGIQVNCEDEQLNAILYANRAIAHFYLGNYQDTLSDAQAARKLKPAYMKAIERGASACEQLHLYEEAITWCDDGLAIDENHEKLVDLRIRCVRENKIFQSPVQAVNESDLPPTPAQTLDFDDVTLRAIAEVYKNDGNEEFGKREFGSAIEFYTKGIEVKCKDEQLNAVLYTNRATAHFYLGIYHDALSDSKAARTRKPCYMKAIIRGASACEKLHLFKEAIRWCNEGLAIDSTNKTLLELQTRTLSQKEKANENKSNLGLKPQTSLGKEDEFQTAEDYQKLHLTIAKEEGHWSGEGPVYGNVGNANQSLSDFKQVIECHKLGLAIAKKVGDRAAEGDAYCNLGNAHQSLSDFKQAIEHYKLHLAITKEVGDRIGEGGAYGNLGCAHQNLGDFQQALGYHKLNLAIAKEVGDRAEEGRACGNIGNAYRSLSDFKQGIEYHKLQLAIAKEVGDRAGETSAYCSIGNAYHSLGDFKEAIKYHKLELAAAKQGGETFGEGRAYGNLGNAHRCLGDVKKAIKYHKLHLAIAEKGDRAGEGGAYGNLGCAYFSLGDFKQALEYHKLHLAIAKEVGHRAGEGNAYGNIGNAYQGLLDFKQAIECQKVRLAIAKEVEDKAGERSAYGNLANAYESLGELKQAIEYNKLHLAAAKEVGDRAGEGVAYGNIGNTFFNLGDFEQAMTYYKLHLAIAKDVGDRAGEGRAYGNLGSANQKLGNFKQAIGYHKLQLAIAKEVGNRAGEGSAYSNLGNAYHMLGSLSAALDYYKACVEHFNKVRSLLQCCDQWKIDLRNEYQSAYTSLWAVLLKQNKPWDALCAAEQGRAQALADLMESQYGFGSGQSGRQEEIVLSSLRCSSSKAMFLALGGFALCIWLMLETNNVRFRQTVVKARGFENNAAKWFESLMEAIHKAMKASIKLEQPSNQEHHLHTLYDLIIAPIAPFLHGDELIIVPDGPLFLAPFAAFLDSNSHYLCDSYRIRLIPSLTSLNWIINSPPDYHLSSGALLVGDPCTEEILTEEGKPLLEPLPSAKEEVERIGQILKISPLIGREAAKEEVLSRLNSVALIHIAAHADITTGEIVLTPNPKRRSRTPALTDFLLTMADVLSVKLRARLVVLSCCHSGKGEIKSEGVIGIARAFLGAGARSVLVSLWTIDDEATLEFMTRFYQHLADGRRASEALNKAMKCLKESDQFSDVKYWAPFVLVGDDVTIECGKQEK